MSLSRYHYLKSLWRGPCCWHSCGLGVNAQDVPHCCQPAQQLHKNTQSGKMISRMCGDSLRDVFLTGALENVYVMVWDHNLDKSFYPICSLQIQLVNVYLVLYFLSSCNHCRLQESETVFSWLISACARRGQLCSFLDSHAAVESRSRAHSPDLFHKAKYLKQHLTKAAKVGSFDNNGVEMLPRSSPLFLTGAVLVLWCRWQGSPAL